MQFASTSQAIRYITGSSYEHRIKLFDSTIFSTQQNHFFSVTTTSHNSAHSTANNVQDTATNNKRPHRPTEPAGKTPRLAKVMTLPNRMRPTLPLPAHAIHLAQGNSPVKEPRCDVESASITCSARQRQSRNQNGRNQTKRKKGSRCVYFDPGHQRRALWHCVRAHFLSCVFECRFFEASAREVASDRLVRRLYWGKRD